MKHLSIYVFALYWAYCGCQQTGDKDCNTMCQKLDTCGFLPSALGSGKLDCERRCNSTSDSIKESVNNCLDDVVIKNSIKEAWCSDSSFCQSARDCVMNSFDDAIPTIGKGAIAIEFSEGINSGSSTHMECANAGYGQKSQEPQTMTVSDTYTPEASEAYCTALQIVEMELFASQQTSKQYRDENVSCSSVLCGQRHFGDILPGLVRVGLKIRGFGSGQDNSSIDQTCANMASETGTPTEELSAWCIVVYAPDAPVTAKEKPTLFTVPMPDVEIMQSLITDAVGVEGSIPQPDSLAAYVCEETANLCSDGIDNDGDLFTDCLDRDCAVFCAEGTESIAATCSDELDNDGDLLVDCGDPDCRALDLCTEEEDTSLIDDSDVDAGTNLPSVESLRQPLPMHGLRATAFPTLFSKS